MRKKVLIWGRYGNYGPDYPRNRVIESVLRSLGCEVSRFLPALSATADIEYALRNTLQRGPRPDHRGPRRDDRRPARPGAAPAPRGPRGPAGQS